MKYIFFSLAIYWAITVLFGLYMFHLNKLSSKILKNLQARIIIRFRNKIRQKYEIGEVRLFNKHAKDIYNVLYFLVGFTQDFRYHLQMFSRDIQFIILNKKLAKQQKIKSYLKGRLKVLEIIEEDLQRRRNLGLPIKKYVKYPVK